MFCYIYLRVIQGKSVLVVFWSWVVVSDIYYIFLTIIIVRYSLNLIFYFFLGHGLPAIAAMIQGYSPSVFLDFNDYVRINMERLLCCIWNTGIVYKFFISNCAL